MDKVQLPRTFHLSLLRAAGEYIPSWGQVNALFPSCHLNEAGAEVLVVLSLSVGVAGEHQYHLAVILQDPFLRLVGGLLLTRFVQGVSLGHPVVELGRVPVTVFLEEDLHVQTR